MKYHHIVVVASELMHHSRLHRAFTTESVLYVWLLIRLREFEH